MVEVLSWSWLATRRSVMFLVWGYLPWGCLNPLAEAKQVHVDLAGEDPFGQLTGGYIRLLCHLRPCHNRLAVRQPSRFILECERFDTGYDNDGRHEVKECWYCLCAYQKCCDPCSVHHDGDTRSWGGCMVGLILESVNDATDTYRRIGLFCHPWRKSGFNPFAEACPEFADVEDLEKLERHEITII